MIEILRRRRNESELERIHPVVRNRFANVIQELERYGHRPRLQETFRSNKEQFNKFKKGLSQISGGGPHTNVLVQGNVLRPASLATHVLDDDAPLNPSVAWVANLAAIAHRYGLTTGVAWAQSDDSDLAPDQPRRLLLESAIVAEDVAKIVEILTDNPKRWGFDPLHLEVLGWRRFRGTDMFGGKP